MSSLCSWFALQDLKMAGISGLTAIAQTGILPLTDAITGFFTSFGGGARLGYMGALGSGGFILSHFSVVPFGQGNCKEFCHTILTAADPSGTDKEASQSSTDYGSVATRAIDGEETTDYRKSSCSHTTKESNPWWEVTYKLPVLITKPKGYEM